MVFAVCIWSLPLHKLAVSFNDQGNDVLHFPTGVRRYLSDGWFAKVIVSKSFSNFFSLHSACTSRGSYQHHMLYTKDLWGCFWGIQVVRKRCRNCTIVLGIKLPIKVTITLLEGLSYLFLSIFYYTFGSKTILPEFLYQFKFLFL